jgi:hypothetical protein
MMLSKIWNRDKFYTCLKWTHDVYNNQINRIVVHGPYRCCVDDSERKLFQMYRISSGVPGFMDYLTETSSMNVTMFEAAGINRALHRRDGIKFEVYR